MATVNNKTYTDLLMLTTLEVSEFCINMERYFKKSSIYPETMNNKIVDMALVQTKINESLSKHIFGIDTNQKVSDVDALKLKYFKSSFDNFKDDVYKKTTEKKDVPKRHMSYSGAQQLNYYTLFNLARDFSNKFDDVIENWSKSYTSIIEKKLLNDLIEPVSSSPAEVKNKI